jgi:hypothetical protein
MTSSEPLKLMECESKTPVGLNPPYGGLLRKLLVERARAEALKAESRDWSSWDLTPRQNCDLELLLNGGFSPLAGFMKRTDYEQVCRGMRLADGTLWPIPVVLDVSEAFAGKIGPGTKIALRDSEGVILAVLTVEDLWRPDRVLEAESVLGSTDRKHSGVKYLLDKTGPVYLGGSGGIAICAPIAPYDAIRREIRELISGQGGFILVYVSTSLAVCEQRDRKGLYVKARAGLLKEFTGISDLYETPADADLVLDTADASVEEACQIILKHLYQAGYLAGAATL